MESSLNKYEYYTYEEFEKYQQSEIQYKMEYDNGYIFCMTPVHPNHDRVKNKLAMSFINHFGFGEKCEVFTSDVAVVFENEKEKFEFLPDIMVCCSSQKFEGLKYKGIPLLIVEILSYATQHRDRGLKLYVYEKFGVKEYWIVDIANECIEVYSNNINGKYMTYNNYTKGMTIKTINNITILVDDVFGVVK